MKKLNKDTILKFFGMGLFSVGLLFLIWILIGNSKVIIGTGIVLALIGVGIFLFKKYKAKKSK